MPIIRRDFLRTTGRLAATAGLLGVRGMQARAAAGAAEASPFRWERIKPDAWVVFNGGGNVLVIADRGGAIVIDSKLIGMGQLLRAEIESRVGPVAAVVITHHHEDHSGGYAAFAGPGTRAIAHGAAVPRIRARAASLVDEARKTPRELTDGLLDALARDFDVPRGPAAERAIAAEVTRALSADPAAGVPGERAADRLEFRVGDTTLELIHVESAHTDNDLFVHDRKRGIIHAGDLLFHRHHPFIDVSAGGNIAGWLETLRHVRRAATGETVVIGGHGPVATPAALDEQTIYFERLRALVARERKAGRSRDDIIKLPNTLYPAYAFPTEWPANLGVAFDEQ